MQAIEFETKINEEFIKIPHFERLKNKHVKVIFLYQENIENSNQSRELPPIFYTPVIRTKYEDFNREEIYNG